MGCQQSQPVAEEPKPDSVSSFTQSSTLLDASIRPSAAPLRLCMIQKIWRQGSGNEDSCDPPVRYDDKRPFEAIFFNDKALAEEGKLILQSKGGEAIAVILKTSTLSSNGQLAFKIFSPRKLQRDQTPSTKHFHEGQALYPYAEAGHYTMMVTGDGAAFVANSLRPTSALEESEEVLTVTRNGSPCAVIRHKATEAEPLWDVEILPGADPCLLLCFAAISDELYLLEREQLEKVEAQAQEPVVVFEEPGQMVVDMADEGHDQQEKSSEDNTECPIESDSESAEIEGSSSLDAAAVAGTEESSGSLVPPERLHNQASCHAQVLASGTSSPALQPMGQSMPPPILA